MVAELSVLVGFGIINLGVFLFAYGIIAGRGDYGVIGLLIILGVMVVSRSGRK